MRVMLWRLSTRARTRTPLGGLSFLSDPLVAVEHARILGREMACTLRPFSDGIAIAVVSRHLRFRAAVPCRRGAGKGAADSSVEHFVPPDHLCGVCLQPCNLPLKIGLGEVVYYNVHNSGRTRHVETVVYVIFLVLYAKSNGQ